jgi:hypothetical protein
MVAARRFEALDPGLPAAALRPLEPVEALPRLPATDGAPPPDMKT